MGRSVCHRLVDDLLASLSATNEVLMSVKRLCADLALAGSPASGLDS